MQPRWGCRAYLRVKARTRAASWTRRTRARSNDADRIGGGGLRRHRRSGRGDGRGRGRGGWWLGTGTQRADRLRADGTTEFAADGAHQLAADGATEFAADGAHQLAPDGATEFAADGAHQLAPDGTTEFTADRAHQFTAGRAVQLAGTHLGTSTSVTADIVNRSTGPGSPWDDEFARYFGARMRSLRMTAYSLCGDWHHAEDITQTALLKLYRIWPRLNHDDGIDAFARKVVLRTYLNERRRPWRGREQLTDALPDTSMEPGGVEDRSLVLGALSAMAPKQQEVLVLRYLRDLTVEETAEELGLSTGTVKSQSARGLATLRRRLGPHFAVLAATAATVALIIAIVLGLPRSTTPPGPVQPAVPAETPPPVSTSGTPPGEPPSSRVDLPSSYPAPSDEPCTTSCPAAPISSIPSSAVRSPR
jgi:RNA polymerase sigma-70 factor (sigma-E family)